MFAVCLPFNNKKMMACNPFQIVHMALLSVSKSFLFGTNKDLGTHKVLHKSALNFWLISPFRDIYYLTKLQMIPVNSNLGQWKTLKK